MGPVRETILHEYFHLEHWSYYRLSQIINLGGIPAVTKWDEKKHWVAESLAEYFAFDALRYEFSFEGSVSESIAKTITEPSIGVFQSGYGAWMFFEKLFSCANANGVTTSEVTKKLFDVSTGVNANGNIISYLESGELNCPFDKLATEFAISVGQSIISEFPDISPDTNCASLGGGKHTRYHQSAVQTLKPGSVLLVKDPNALDIAKFELFDDEVVIEVTDVTQTDALFEYDNNSKTSGYVNSSDRSITIVPTVRVRYECDTAKIRYIVFSRSFTKGRIPNAQLGGADVIAQLTPTVCDDPLIGTGYSRNLDGVFGQLDCTVGLETPVTAVDPFNNIYGTSRPVAALGGLARVWGSRGADGKCPLLGTNILLQTLTYRSSHTDYPPIDIAFEDILTPAIHTESSCDDGFNYEVYPARSVYKNVVIPVVKCMYFSVDENYLPVCQ